jgi:uncharacterized protein
MEGEVKAGLKSGEWKYYYESGSLKEQSQYAHDKRNGISVRYLKTDKKS